MKQFIRRIFLLSILQLVAWGGMAQQIDGKLVGLRIDRPRGDSAVHLGQQRADVIRVLGVPTKQETQSYGIDGQPVEVLWYRKNRLFFRNTQLVEFDLIDDKLVIGETPKTSFGVKFKIANTPQQIAKDAQRLSPNYINSCNILAGFNWEPKPGISRGILYASRYSTYLGNGSAKPRAWLEVLFNDSGEVINVAAGLL